MQHQKENHSNHSSTNEVLLPLRPDELELIVGIRDAERSGVKLAMYGATRGLLQACLVYLEPPSTMTLPGG